MVIWYNNLMIGESFFFNNLNVMQIEESIIQLNYNILYYTGTKNYKRTQVKDQKELFVLVSLHKWLKENKVKNFKISFIGNLKNFHHHKEFGFHVNDLDSKTLYTITFNY